MSTLEYLKDTSWSQLFLLSTLSYLLYVVLEAIYNVTVHPLSSYPGPLFARATSLPMVWNLGRGYQSDYVIDCHKKYGHVVRVAPGELSYNSQEAWRDIFGHESPSASRKWASLYRKDNPAFNQTMQSADDETHSRLRRIFNPAFSEKSLRQQEPMLKQTVEVMVDRIERFHKENPTEAINLSQFMMCVTFDIMGEFTLAQRFGLIENMEIPDWMADQQTNTKAIVFIMSSAYLRVLKPIASFFMWMFFEQLSALLTFATKQVELRLKRDAPEKRFDLLEFALRGDKSNGGMTPQEINSNAMLFLLAGFDTPANAIVGILWYLHANPEVYSILKSEIRNAFKSLDDITLQSCTELPYLQACIEEGLRIHSPVKTGLPRVTPPEGMVIEGKFVPGQTVVYVSTQAASISPDNFQDPEKFIPERWIGNQYASDKKNARQPFSFGARNCIGKSFAYHEMRLILATLISSFDIHVRKDSEAWGVDLKVYITAERRPLWVNFEKRI